MINTLSGLGENGCDWMEVVSFLQMERTLKQGQWQSYASTQAMGDGNAMKRDLISEVTEATTQDVGRMDLGLDNISSPNYVV